MAAKQLSDIPTLPLLYKLKKLSSPPAGKALFAPSASINARVSVAKLDITNLAVDAIVNAANTRMLGGGGVDGAIHAAAGPELLLECHRVGGCRTGSAKITKGYRLPASRVIHAVGPVYDAGRADEAERLLASCYTTSLDLAVQNNCRTVAFPCISTGVYGYPSKDGSLVATEAVREYLEGSSGDKLDRVVFVTFLDKDVDAYNTTLPLMFPPAEDADKDKSVADEQAHEQEHEAAEVEAALPSVPTTEPDDAENPQKKQRQDE